MTESLTQLARRSSGTRSDTEKAASRRLDLVRQLAEEFAERNALYELIDRTVYMADEVKIPARWENFALEVKAPLALRAVNTITAALSVNAPVTHFEPIRQGSAGEQNATLREHFFDAAWQRQEDEADRQLFRVWMHHLVTHGTAWLKTVECSKTAWGQYYTDSRALATSLDEQGLSESARRSAYDSGTEELKRRASYPIMTTVPRPSNMYYIPSERGFSLVAEVSDVPYYEALTAFDASVSRGGRIVPEAEGLPREEWDRVMSGTRTLRKIEVWEWDRCFPAGTMVGLDSAPQAVSRRWYEGQLVEIATASGYQLAGTPNHPILTNRGWVGLGELTEGDRVISRRLSQDQALVRPHGKHGDTEISELFDLAAKAHPAERHAGRPQDFHGDGQHGNIDVVPIDRELQDRLFAPHAQPVREAALVGANVGERALASERSLTELLGIGGSATQGSARPLMHRGAPVIGPRRLSRDSLQSDGMPFSSGRASVPNLAGGTAVAERDARSFEPPTDESQRAAKLAGDGGDALLALDVAPDDVVRVNRRAFSGYVYNLETESQHYVANDIISHNCYYYLCDPGGSMGTARLVKSVRHGYGNPMTHTLRGPYFMANGITTSSNDHKYAGLSVIFGFLYLYPLFNSMLTGLGQGGFQWAYPFLGSDQPPTFPQMTQQGMSPLVGPGGQPIQSTLQLQPGDVLPPGLHFVDPPRLGVDMHSFMQQVQTLLEMALPSVVQGLVTGDQSGYAINQASYLARLEWDPIVKQAERALSRRVGFESWLIESRIQEKVYAWGDLPTSGPFASSRAGYLSIGPEDLNGAHRYHSRLEPETPSNRTIDLRSHSEMVAQRFESWEDAVEAMGNSPSEVELAWLLFDVKNDPRSKGKILDRTFALIAIREQQERQAAEADMLDALGGGQPPGAGLGPNVGQVYQPGQNGVPLTPGVPGMAGGAPGPIAPPPPGAAGPIGGMPVVPGPPANALPMPGQPL